MIVEKENFSITQLFEAVRHWIEMVSLSIDLISRCIRGIC